MVEQELRVHGEQLLVVGPRVREDEEEEQGVQPEQQERDGRRVAPRGAAPPAPPPDLREGVPVGADGAEDAAVAVAGVAGPGLGAAEAGLRLLALVPRVRAVGGAPEVAGRPHHDAAIAPPVRGAVHAARVKLQRQPTAPAHRELPGVDVPDRPRRRALDRVEADRVGHVVVAHELQALELVGPVGHRNALGAHGRGGDARVVRRADGPVRRAAVPVDVRLELGGHQHPGAVVHLMGGGGGGTMGQVCFTAISSNCACPTVFIALSSVFQIIVLCALLSECSMAGVEGQGPFLPAALYQVS